MRRAAVAFAAVLVLTGAGPGGRIVYSDFLPNEQIHLFLERADGTGRVRLTHRPRYWMEPRWSPDGRRIGAFHGVGLAVLTPDGKVARLLRAPGDTHQLRWSPDGKRIAYTVSHCFDPTGKTEPICADLWVVQVKSGVRRRLSPPGDVDLSQSPFTLYSWSPDGRSIVYKGSKRLIVVDVASGRRRGLGQRTDLIQESPQWSPDGRSILFSRQRASGKDFDLALVSPDGSGLRVIPGTFGAFEPRWSPDGTHIAYLRNAGDLWAVLVSRPDGSDRIRIGPAYDYQALDWSPDSSRVLVIGPRDTFALWRADGTGKPLLIHGGGDDPDWGP